MHIRQLHAGEFEERSALSEFAFQMKLSPERLEEERNGFRPEQHWGAFSEEGRLLSGLALLPFEVWVQGKLLRMGGIAMVATWPEARRNGCVAQLLSRSLETMRAQGQTISMLAPFAFPFYRKFGWEMTVERKKYELDMALLPGRKGSSSGYIERSADLAVLDLIYREAAPRYTGMLVRTEAWWRQRVLSDRDLTVVWKDDEGAPRGYMIYEVSNRKLTVRDWAYTNREAQAALWSFIAQHDSMADRIELTVPMDDGMPFLLPNPRFKQEIVPYFMSRIVDVAGAVAAYPFERGERGEKLALRVRDEHASWNDGEFVVEWDEDGTAKVIGSRTGADGREQSEAPTDEPAASCSVQTLAAMLLGNRRPGWLRETGLLAGDDAAIGLLERRIPTRLAYLADFF